MTFVGENQKYYAVKVHPKLQEDMDTFKSAIIYLERTYLLPGADRADHPGRPQRPGITPWQLINANQPVDQVFFKGGVPQGGWKVEKNPAAGVAQQGPAAGRPGGVGAMPRR